MSKPKTAQEIFFLHIRDQMPFARGLIFEPFDLYYQPLFNNFTKHGLFTPPEHLISPSF